MLRCCSPAGHALEHHAQLAMECGLALDADALWWSLVLVQLSDELILDDNSAMRIMAMAVDVEMDQSDRFKADSLLVIR